MTISCQYVKEMPLYGTVLKQHWNSCMVLLR